MPRIIELKWTCGECGTKGILGRHKRCPSCGSPRERGEMQMDGLASSAGGYNPASTVTDSKLLDLATAGADWFCTHCGSGNRGASDKCVGDGRRAGCGAPRYGKAAEDHPDFGGDHRKVVIGDDPWEDGYEAPEWRPEVPAARPPPSARRPPQRRPAPRRTSYVDRSDDTALDWMAQRRKQRERQVLFGAGAVAVLVALAVVFLIWAFQTHEAEGTVSGMTWQQSTIVQHWTQVKVRRWQDETRQRREIEPRNGSGEQAGMVLLGGCREEHHHTEQYACGTRTESYDCSTTEQYACGETCRDNGNGFATCSTKYCTRTNSKTCTREVTKYCDRDIYETRCNYQTQEWKTIQTVPASGKGLDTRWPDAETGRLDRLRYSADYTVSIAYTDRGESEVYDLKPGGTKFLGMTKVLTAGEARKAEKAYLSWEPGETVTLSINNLGGIHSVMHGGMEIEAE
jgi:hypothetical protein